MVKKILLTIAIVLTLSACQSQQVKTVYVDKYVPIPYVPHPPVVTRPVLDIQTLSPEQKTDKGELIKSLNVSLHQATAYACSLESIVKQYNDLSNMSMTSILATPAILTQTPGTLATVWSKLFSSVSTTQTPPVLPVLPTGSCNP